jgi:hypothetical protein
MQCLPNLFCVGHCDSWTVIDPQNNDFLMGQSRQYAANFTASNAEHLAQAVLGKATAGQEALFENGIEDPCIEILC